jgi:hypothetical protein
MSLLNKQLVSVRNEGQIVVLKIGNSEMKMDHEAALQISTWMRVKAKEAKRLAGDNSRKWNVVGNLAAIEAGERPY